MPAKFHLRAPIPERKRVIMKIILQFTPIYDEATYEYTCYAGEKVVAKASCRMNTQTVCIDSLPSECKIKIICNRKQGAFHILKRWKQLDYIEYISLRLTAQIHRNAEIQIQTRSKVCSYKGEQIRRMFLDVTYSNLKVHEMRSEIPWTGNECRKFFIRNLSARICIPALLAACMPIEMIYAVQNWEKPVAMNGMTGTDQFFLAVGMEAVLILFLAIRIHKFRRLFRVAQAKE